MLGIFGSGGAIVAAIPINHGLMGTFTAVTVVSSLAGTRVARKLHGESLTRGFAWFLLLVATYTLYKSMLGNGT